MFHLGHVISSPYKDGKRSRTNLAFDFAFGKDGSHGAYFRLVEAF